MARKGKIPSVELEARCRDPKGFPRLRLPEIAFAGRSNVGKSSLINALLNRRGVVGVSSTPGKTRSIDFLLINGSFRFVDLPGYGYAKVSRDLQRRWKVLIETYLRERETLAAVVWILDIRRGVTDLDRMLREWFEAYSLRYIPVCTKADKLGRGERLERGRALAGALGGEADPVLFSAKTGLGRDLLWRRMREAMEALQGGLSRPLFDGPG